MSDLWGHREAFTVGQWTVIKVLWDWACFDAAESQNRFLKYVTNLGIKGGRSPPFAIHAGATQWANLRDGVALGNNVEPCKT